MAGESWDDWARIGAARLGRRGMTGLGLARQALCDMSSQGKVWCEQGRQGVTYLGTNWSGSAGVASHDYDRRGPAGQSGPGVMRLGNARQAGYDVSGRDRVRLGVVWQAGCD